MNRGMQILLKSLGLEVTPETLAMLSALLPQIPAKINEVITHVNATLQNFDQRLKTIEVQVSTLATIAKDDSKRWLDSLQHFETRLDAFERKIEEASHGISIAPESAADTRGNGGIITG